MNPSTQWREIIGKNEDQVFEGYAKAFGVLQNLFSKKYGKGRTLHRKGIVALKGQLEVFGGTNEYAKQGLFSKPLTYSTEIRLSNGGLKVEKDNKPDIRGFAIKVLGVNGKGALSETTTEQDFLLINHETFGPGHASPFVGIVIASAKGPLGLISYFYKNYGLKGMFAQIKKAKATLEKKFTGFATESFHSAAPINWGPYAVKVKITPKANKPHQVTAADWSKEIKTNLSENSWEYDFQVQFFVSEEHTPLEDASIKWNEEVSPYVTVGKLSIPQQEFESASSKALSEKIEKGAFDPWTALLEHKPLGDVMRARKVVYFMSQKNR